MTLEEAISTFEEWIERDKKIEYADRLENIEIYRQVAEWLRTLKAYGEARKKIERAIEMDIYASGLRYAEQIIHELVDEEENE